jgi:hypothetical protein
MIHAGRRAANFSRGIASCGGAGVANSRRSSKRGEVRRAPDPHAVVEAFRRLRSTLDTRLKMRGRVSFSAAEAKLLRQALLWAEERPQIVSELSHLGRRFAYAQMARKEAGDLNKRARVFMNRMLGFSDTRKKRGRHYDAREVVHTYEALIDPDPFWREIAGWTWKECGLEPPASGVKRGLLAAGLAVVDRRLDRREAVMAVCALKGFASPNATIEFLRKHGVSALPAMRSR